jgi:hypothetical protein
LEISAALANLPTDILDICKDMDAGNLQELDATAVNDLSIRIPSNLLDLNIEEEMASLRTFQDIVQRQRKAREKLIYLLLKSRCQFGSDVAARDFYLMEGIEEKLKKRKQLLGDALDLEGFDVSEIDKDSKEKNSANEALEERLPPLLWYKPEEMKESDSKKQRTT